MLNGTEKVPPLITDFKEYHTDTTVRFVVKMSAEKLREAEAAGLHKVFKLQSPLTCNSMVKAATCVYFITEGESTLVAFIKTPNLSFTFFFLLGFRFCLTTWAA